MIAFSGLDGAGKSTQISLLRDFYKTKKIKTQMFWSRGGYTPGMERVKGLLRRCNNSTIPKDRGLSSKRDESFSNGFIRKSWLTLAILDLIYYYAIYIRIIEFFGTVIICDRYLFDTSLDFKRNFPQENVDKWFLWRLLMRVSTTPKKHFILTISVKESQYRSTLKDEPFPDSKETLKFRLDEYLKYGYNNKFVVEINCEKSIELIHQQIITYLKK
jgi:thymidylate kinase